MKMKNDQTHLHGFAKTDNEKKDHVSSNMLIVNLFVGLYYHPSSMDAKTLQILRDDNWQHVSC